MAAKQSKANSRVVIGVAVLMDVADLDVVMAAMENQAMADAMEHDGVLPEPLVLLVEA
jgi:hypothetical protein